MRKDTKQTIVQLTCEQRDLQPQPAKLGSSALASAIHLIGVGLWGVASSVPHPSHNQNRPPADALSHPQPPATPRRHRGYWHARSLHRDPGNNARPRPRARPRLLPAPRLHLSCAQSLPFPLILHAKSRSNLHCTVTRLRPPSRSDPLQNPSRQPKCARLDHTLAAYKATADPQPDSLRLVP